MVNYKELLDDLKSLKEKNDKEIKVLDNAINIISSFKHSKEVITDIVGNEYKPLTLRDILVKLGVSKLSNQVFMLDENDEKDKALLDKKVRLLEDDGMGYGARNGSCNDAIIIDNETNKEIQLWF
jgi:hypothetical protein